MGSMSSPTHILITGGAGFIGQELAAALLLHPSSPPTLRLTLTDMIAPPVPPGAAHLADRITSVKSDLTDPAAVAGLLRDRFSAVYLLHGLMSGGAEANLELGWRVNLDSHRYAIDHLRQHHPGTVTVFPSSLAVYGPSKHGDVTDELTTPLPQSSYGAQKLMIETYLNDMSRRGLLDGRIVRLPTIIVRPGAPSAAASSFASGIVREPLKGEESVLPVSRSLEMWVCSPDTVVANLILAKYVPAERFGGSRVINLPGITVTVQDILDALESVGGAKAVALVKEQRDPKIEAIVGTWPARFNTSRAKALGMQPDFELAENARRFAKQQGIPQ
ncbi:D-erythronate dehydrogenase [Paramyrothecium foliicola]|nr:D-erythronate dehydrogenase [Paramyrothecium foliicola]